MKALSNLDKIQRGVEVGTWRGHTSIDLIKRFPNLFLYLVDLYQDKTTDTHLLKNFSAKEACEEAKRHLSGHEHRCHWLIMDSVEAAKQIKDASLDFAFIDADHHYESVLQDIKIYLPKIRSGGIMAGHDFGPHFEGVEKAVYEMFPKEKVIVPEGVSRIWWTRIGLEKQTKGFSLVKG
jgi:predicted O-methyltransferase YrrM